MRGLQISSIRHDCCLKAGRETRTDVWMVIAARPGACGWDLRPSFASAVRSPLRPAAAGFFDRIHRLVPASRRRSRSQSSPRIFSSWRRIGQLLRRLFRGWLHFRIQQIENERQQPTGEVVAFPNSLVPSSGGRAKFNREDARPVAGCRKGRAVVRRALG